MRPGMNSLEARRAQLRALGRGQFPTWRVARTLSLCLRTCLFHAHPWVQGSVDRNSPIIDLDPTHESAVAPHMRPGARPPEAPPEELPNRLPRPGEQTVATDSNGTVQIVPPDQMPRQITTQGGPTADSSQPVDANGLQPIPRAPEVKPDTSPFTSSGKLQATSSQNSVFKVDVVEGSWQVSADNLLRLKLSQVNISKVAQSNLGTFAVRCSDGSRVEASRTRSFFAGWHSCSRLSKRRRIGLSTLLRSEASGPGIRRRAGSKRTPPSDVAANRSSQKNDFMTLLSGRGFWIGFAKVPPYLPAWAIPSGRRTGPRTLQKRGRGGSIHGGVMRKSRFLLNLIAATAIGLSVFGCDSADSGAIGDTTDVIAANNNTITATQALREYLVIGQRGFLVDPIPATPGGGQTLPTGVTGETIAVGTGDADVDRAQLYEIFGINNVPSPNFNLTTPGGGGATPNVPVIEGSNGGTSGYHGVYVRPDQ